MDQDTVVNEQLDSGKRVIESVGAAGFEVRVAFWAKLSDEDNWYLYLASPFVDETGPRAAYDLVFGVLRNQPNLWIDPFEIRVIGLRDTLTRAALEVIDLKHSNGSSSAQNRRSYPGITRFGGSSLGGVSIDGAYIYPPQPGVSV